MKKATEIGITDDVTLEQAKNVLRQHANEGFICPCCQQPAKVYRRTITSAMAIGLICMYRLNFCNGIGGQIGYFSKKFEYIHLENFFKNLDGIPASVRGDLPKLRFWNLIEPKPGEKEDGNPCNGYYRLTWLGKEFVLGNQPVQKIITIYNNRRLGQVNEAGTITIHKALKNRFNYKALMEGQINGHEIK